MPADITGQPPRDSGLLPSLRAAVGAAGVIDDPAAMAPYLCDYRGLYHGHAPLVLRPASVAEVSKVLALCNAAGVGVVPQGGNTGYCGGATPDESGTQIVLSLSRLNRIRAVEPLNYSMTVEAGCVLATAQQAASQAGRLLPLSLGAEGSCQIGGNLSTNAGGTAVLRYGMARDLVLGLEVVLADGSVLSTLGSLRKDNTGYDLKSLFVGAEGTLGVITAATLKLFPGVATTATALIAIDGIDAAVMLMGKLRAASADHLAACEIMARAALELVVRHVPGCRDPFGAWHPWYLLVELQSAQAHDELVTLLQRTLSAMLDQPLIRDVIIAGSAAQRAALWKLRECISDSMALEGAQIKHDVSVPIGAMPAFHAQAGAWILQQSPGARLVIFGHIGDGNLHYNVSEPAGGDPGSFRAATAEIEQGVHDIAVQHGGSFSAEHGIGRYKIGALLRYGDPVELALMRSIKQALDPNGIMNPGKLLASAGAIS
jgi:FAD/FMN-containing dehydrogenase